MPFRNPIVGNVDLIRNAIESENYDPGNAGWRLSKNGDAEVNDLVSRGYAAGPNASYDTIAANDSFTYLGDELSDLLAEKNGGIVAYGYANSDSDSFSSTPVELATLYYHPKAGHIYRSRIQGSIELQKSTYAAALLSVNTSGGLAADGSTRYRQYTDVEQTTTRSMPFLLESLDPARGTSRIGIGLTAYAHGGTAFIRASTRQFLLMTIEDVGTFLPPNGANLHHWSGDTTPPLTTHTFQRYCTATNSRSQDGKVLSDGHNNRAYQGDYGDFGGNRYTDIGFDSSDLQGVGEGNVHYVDIYLYVEHTYSSSGTTLELGYVATNGKYYGPYVTKKAYEGTGYWIHLHGSKIEAAMLNGTISYMRLGPAPSHSTYYYCYCNGHPSSTGPGAGPALRASYDK
jgi:hypothetical protein